ncbi:hypothetical protein [Bradyrhizobium sp.]|nr:hypothetical protein [Bradyrhizobium sp.]MBV8699787.1 hypothetical protein [Bradyrhizobium sp.]MBV8916780.1 hypothetical protein [Bradyrhizobium sp.]MBV9983858.1 hypothetical protein [Bradyrhizobium sp.]
MASNEGLVARSSSVRVPLLTEKVLVATILLLFLLLHGLAGVMLKSTNAGGSATSEQDVRDMALRLHD